MGGRRVSECGGVDRKDKISQRWPNKAGTGPANANTQISRRNEARTAWLTLSFDGLDCQKFLGRETEKPIARHDKNGSTMVNYGRRIPNPLVKTCLVICRTLY